MERDYSKLPFITLSKENLQLLYDSVEKEQVGNIMFAVYEHLYFGVIPTFETKVETGAYNQLIAVIERKAEGYFKQVEGGAKGAEFGKLGGRPKKNTDAEIKPVESPKEVETINPSTNEINPEFDGFCERTYDIIEEWDNEFNNIVKEYIKGDTESVRRASNKLTDILKSNGLHKTDRESQEIFKYLTEKREMLATA